MKQSKATSKADETLAQILKQANIDPALFQKLIQVEKTKVHLKRRRGIKQELRQIIESSIA